MYRLLDSGRQEFWTKLKMKMKRNCVVSIQDRLIPMVGIPIVLLLVGITSVAGEQTAAPTANPDQSKPFYETTMFIGLSLGIGIFLGLLLGCCAVWKFCCPKKTD